MKPKKDTASLAVIGVDIGKEVFHLVGLAVDGKIAFRKKVRRLGFEDAFEKLPPSIVGIAGGKTGNVDDPDCIVGYRRSG